MTETPINQQRWLQHMSAGKRNFQQGKLELAAQEFSEAIQLLPERVEGWVNFGSTLIEARRYDAAVDILQKAVSANKGLMVAHLLLGDALRMQGQWAQACASYHTAVSLERAPLSLNKLACVLRVEGTLDLAEGLYREALDKDPSFFLARVNLATVQIEQGHYDEAQAQLDKLGEVSLPPPESREVASARLAIKDHQHLDTGITALLEHDDPAPLEHALRDSPKPARNIDKKLWESIQRYAYSATQLTAEPVQASGPIPDEWPLIEAMCMIPMVHSASEYQQMKAKLEGGVQADSTLLASTNMEKVIRTARSCREDMQDPVMAEVHLRHWHGLACRKVAGYHPGHFKYTQNWVPEDPTLVRVEPSLASVTFQHFISKVYQKSPPGIMRAALVYMVMADLHVFMDGNTRTAFTWLNRELEWSGHMPAIFPEKQALKGSLHQALADVRHNDGDLSPLVDAIIQGQKNAVKFCAELDDH